MSSDADLINKAYRRNDVKRWQSLDFVIGYEVKLSNNPKYGCDTCKRLAGKYPKAFIWDGWHDECKCFVIAVLMEDETFRENRVSRFRSILHDTEHIQKKSANEIIYVPESFIDWYLENREAFIKENNTPDFVTNNIDIITQSYDYYKNKSI